MPFWKRKAVDTKLERVTENLLDEMLENGPDTDEYSTNLEYLEKVNAIRNSTLRPTLNPNQIALVAGNLIGVLIIVAYERTHAMTSKAKDLLLKSK